MAPTSIMSINTTETGYDYFDVGSSVDDVIPGWVLIMGSIVCALVLLALIVCVILRQGKLLPTAAAVSYSRVDQPTFGANFPGPLTSPTAPGLPPKITYLGRNEFSYKNPDVCHK